MERLTSQSASRRRRRLLPSSGPMAGSHTTLGYDGRSRILPTLSCESASVADPDGPFGPRLRNDLRRTPQTERPPVEDGRSLGGRRAGQTALSSGSGRAPATGVWLGVSVRRWW